LSCDSDAPQVGGARSDATSVVNVLKRTFAKRDPTVYSRLLVHWEGKKIHTEDSHSGTSPFILYSYPSY